MPEIDTIHRAQVDRFVLDLVEAGFEPQDTAASLWEGPIEPALVDLTSAKTMTIKIRDGWPYRHPWVYVEGLRPSVHLQDAALCLWLTGDDSYGWLRLSDLRDRIAQWSERYRGRATLDDPILDPHLYWTKWKTDLLATIDLTPVRYGNGGSGDLEAELKGRILKIGVPGPLRVRWYGRESMRNPPVNMAMVEDGLKREQVTNLRRELERVGSAGGADYLMLIWDTPVGEANVLLLALTIDGADLKTEAIEVARIDRPTLLKRAGPDAPTLADRRVVIFGQGAIGSNVSSLLSRTGLGHLRLIDGATLRPGDLIRHASSRFFVGQPKAAAMKFDLETEERLVGVEYVDAQPIAPAQLRRWIDGQNLIVDAVGEASFTDQVSRIAAETTIPIVSVALYRGGAVGRVRIAQGGVLPIHERPDPPFRVIPPDPAGEPVSWETGCASPINNAPPTEVVGAAARASRLIVDVLVGRLTESVDVVEVFRALETEPYDRPAILRFPE